MGKERDIKEEPVEWENASELEDIFVFLRASTVRFLGLGRGGGIYFLGNVFSSSRHEKKNLYIYYLREKIKRKPRDFSNQRWKVIIHLLLLFPNRQNKKEKYGKKKKNHR
jgi:hypothetical protein